MEQIGLTLKFSGVNNFWVLTIEIGRLGLSGNVFIGGKL